MALSLSLAQSILIMFVMLACGFAAVKLGILKSEDSRILSLLSVYIIVPCMIVDSFQVECTPERLSDFVILLIAAGITHIVFVAAARLLRGPMKLKRVEEASLIYTNSGNLIMPLIALTLGEDMVFFATPYTLIFTVLCWTHGRTLICGGQGKTDLRKIFLNINVLACFAGLILFMAGITLPTVPAKAVSSLGSMTGPINMLLAGMLIAGTDLRKAFTNGRVYIITALRLLALPALLILVLKLTGLSARASSDSVLMITLLAASAPCASTVTSIAQVYDSDPETAVTLNVVTMLLCVITMPVINLLYQVIL